MDEQKFTWSIGERQFSVVRHTANGDELMALSSSMSTLVKCINQMMQLAGKDVVFDIVPAATGTAYLLRDRWNVDCFGVFSTREKAEAYARTQAYLNAGYIIYGHTVDDPNADEDEIK